MDEQHASQSLCHRCEHSGYDGRYTKDGRYYRDWSCAFPQHRHIYGHVHNHTQCEDFSEERK